MRKICLYLIIFLDIAGCRFYRDTPCQDTIKSQTYSLGREYVATVYERDCGATTDYSGIVNLQLGTAKFSADKNVVFVVKGQKNVSVMWSEINHLEIVCVGCHSNDIFKQEPRWQSIEISYTVNAR